MAKVTKPRTTRGITSSLVKGIFIPAKILRRAIDRDKRIKQITSLDDQYAKRYEEMRQATLAHVAKYGPGSFKQVEVGGKKQGIQGRTAERQFEGDANFRQQKRFFDKLFPEMFEGFEFGHKNIGILSGGISLALDGMTQDDQRRPALRALFQTVKELDGILTREQIKGENSADLIQQVIDAAASKRNFTIDYKSTVNILKGLEGKIELEAEELGLNQLKGTAAAFFGEIFKEIITGEQKKLEEFLSNFDLTELKGSPTIRDTIDAQLGQVLDPRITKSTPVSITSTAGGIIKAAKINRKRRKALKAPIKAPQRRNDRRIAAAPLAIIKQLNNRLPGKLRQNLNAPALQNQTGRFADSVEITGVIQTPKGYPSFGYTYAKNPYQVFEMGNGDARWATPERDPRRTIEGTIRELAAEFAIGRFFLRRE